MAPQNLLYGSLSLPETCPFQGNLAEESPLFGHRGANLAHRTVTARFWPWFSGRSPEPLSSCSLFDGMRCTPVARTREAQQVTSAATGYEPYRGTSLIRNTPLLGPYNRRTMPRGICWSQGGGRFLMSEVPLQEGTLLEPAGRSPIHPSRFGLE